MRDKTLQMILVRARDYTNAELARRASDVAGERISDDKMQRYIAGTNGIPIENLGPLLSALGLKVVPESTETIDAEEVAALRVLARKGLA